MKRMLFNAAQPEELRVAIVSGQSLLDLDIESSHREKRKSNIYVGVVTRVEPSLDAVFVDYGVERHGFLPFKEVEPSYCSGSSGGRSKAHPPLCEGQELLVQIEKEERGSKGAALTTYISLAGRYLVLMPNNPKGGGVSRRIEGDDRTELKSLIEGLLLPPGMSLIGRTAAIGRSFEELRWDLDYLLKLWEAIFEASRPCYRTATGTVALEQTHDRVNPPPFLIYEESSIVIRAIRDYFQPDIEEILIDTSEIYEQAKQFMSHVMPHNLPIVKRYSDSTPLFSRFQIERQIETAHARTVVLPSGGAVVFDHSEALVAIDVNSSRATGGADIEETALQTNLEAADEIGRQLRLRDLGGLIVIDFIDMESIKNQRAVEQKLRDALQYDRARVQMGKISKFGLLELSRQRLRSSLGESVHTVCPRCSGTGFIRNIESSALHILRVLQEEVMKEHVSAIHVHLPVDVATFLLNEKRNQIMNLESRFRVALVLVPTVSLETPAYHLHVIRADGVSPETDTSSYRLIKKDASLESPERPNGLADRSRMKPIVKTSAILPSVDRTPAAHASSRSIFFRVWDWLKPKWEEKPEEEVARAPSAPVVPVVTERKLESPRRTARHTTSETKERARKKSTSSAEPRKTASTTNSRSPSNLRRRPGRKSSKSESVDATDAARVSSENDSVVVAETNNVVSDDTKVNTRVQAQTTSRRRRGPRRRRDSRSTNGRHDTDSSSELPGEPDRVVDADQPVAVRSHSEISSAAPSKEVLVTADVVTTKKNGVDRVESLPHGLVLVETTKRSSDKEHDGESYFSSSMAQTPPRFPQVRSDDEMPFGHNMPPKLVQVETKKDSVN